MFPDILAKPTRDCAFRIILSREEVLADPEIAHLVQGPSSIIWFGPERHIVAYTIRGTQLYNVVFCGPGKASVGVWNEPANLDDLREEYKEYESTVKRILGVAKSCHKWQIGEVPDLPTWLNHNGKLVLSGDSAHAMMPYTAQVSPVSSFST
jgi:salicylate hydroxylase